MKFDQKGFTLIELMVVITIFLIITAVIFFDAPRFRDNSAIDLIAQDVAVSIRSAQSYGIGAKVDEGGDLSPIYGIRFYVNENRFVLFKGSRDGDGYIVFPENSCVVNPNDVCFQEYQMNGGFITDLYFESESNQSNSLNILDIAFARPHSESYFCGEDKNDCFSIDEQKAVIIIGSDRAARVREIHVHKNGQIEVKAPTN